MSVNLVTQLVGVSVLVLLTLVLTGFVLLIRSRLAPVGGVDLVINRAGLVVVEVGLPLLDVLFKKDIVLPAACGGRGNCGQCVVTVVAGGGEAFPNERAHLSSREIAEGKRLACMLKVRQAMTIEIPDGMVDSRRIACRVVSKRHITPFMMELNLAVANDGEQFHFKAGQYLLLEAPPYQLRFTELELDPAFREQWVEGDLLKLEAGSSEVTRRAYSLASNPTETERITLVVRIALPPPNVTNTVPPGIVSSWVFGVRPEQQINVAGPFGDFLVQEGEREMVLIAGGAGIAPIRSIIFEQLGSGFPRKVTFWYGVRNVQELCYEAEFDTLAKEHENFSWHAALSEPKADSQWAGYRGFIHNVVHDRYLASHPAPEELEYYLCGPPVMSSAVKKMLIDLGVDNRSIFFDDFGSA